MIGECFCHVAKDAAEERLQAGAAAPELAAGKPQRAFKAHGVCARADAEAAQASLAGLQEELAAMDSSIADAKKVCFVRPPGCSRS